VIGPFPEVGHEIAGCALDEERHGAMFQRLFAGRDLSTGERVLVAVAAAYPGRIDEIAAAIGRPIEGIGPLLRAADVPGYASPLQVVVEVEPPGQPMTARGRLPEEVAARIGGEVAALLERAHRQELALLGVRPEVTYVAETDDGARLAGLALRGVSFLAAAPPRRGGPCMPDVYLPREVWAAGPTLGSPAAVFGLCATIWFAATGTAPFPAEPSFQHAVERVLDGALPEWTGSPALGDVLIRGLDPDPARRPGTAEIARALAALG
jgi:hypothetical protein